MQPTWNHRTRSAVSSSPLTRRRLLRTLAGFAVGVNGGRLLSGQRTRTVQLATFQADVTPPLGHPLLGGWIQPAKQIADPLEARGLVLFGAEEPIVVLSIDWCELRNDAYDRWRDALAEVVGTRRERVLVSCVHQHDAPYADLTAQRLMDQHGLIRAMFYPDFFEQALQRVAKALRDAVATRRRVTHFGIGQAKVQKVACNRRVQLPGQPPRFNRYSFTGDPAVRDAPEGQIDPFLKTISFWDGDQPLAALSCYATHPMSRYGQGNVSADFPGLARRLRQKQQPDVFQIYLTGCSGDVTAAKYNDGTPKSRELLAQRLCQGMAAAWDATRRFPLDQVDFRVVPLRLPVERAGKLAPEALQKTLANSRAPYQTRCQAALGLSWQKRCDAGQPIDLPVLDLGAAQFLVLPAESFVAYQLAAQQTRPDSFVMVAGFGECAPGYIPTEKTRAEGFVKEHGYCWVAAGSEQVILAALRRALKKRQPRR
ncbi:MAG: hypothetical protein GXP27_07780 [Planctomycetes bacterium]|nr:hypothetical protein [Planctomycetota bacterium]